MLIGNKCSRCKREMEHHNGFGLFVPCVCNKEHPQFIGSQSGAGTYLVDKYYQGYGLEDYYRIKSKHYK